MSTSATPEPRLTTDERRHLKIAHDDLRAVGLRPVVDPWGCCVKSECPSCHAGADDPLGIWLPLTVVCGEPDRVRLLCTAGCTENQVRDALAALEARGVA